MQNLYNLSVWTKQSGAEAKLAARRPILQLVLSRPLVPKGLSTVLCGIPTLKHGIGLETSSMNSKLILEICRCRVLTNAWKKHHIVSIIIICKGKVYSTHLPCGLTPNKKTIFLTPNSNLISKMQSIAILCRICTNYLSEQSKAEPKPNLQPGDLFYGFCLLYTSPSPRD